MKKLRTKQSAKIVACILFVAALTVCFSCGAQVSWLLANGGYQGSSVAVLDEREASLAADLTGQVAESYRQAQESGSYFDPESVITDKNFFFTIKTPDGETVVASEELGTYREKRSVTIEVNGKAHTETIRRTYDSEEAREEGLEGLIEQYSNAGSFGYSLTDSAHSDSAEFDPETETETAMEETEEDALAVGSEQAETSIRYYLTFEVTTRDDPETFVVTGFLRNDLVAGGQIYQELGYISTICAWQYELLGVTIFSGLLGVLSLAFLLYATGHRKDQEEIALHWIDRTLGTDLLVVGGIILLLILASVRGSAGGYAFFLVHDTIILLVCLIVLLVVVLSLARRKKAGILKENLLVRRIASPVSQRGKRFKARCGELLKKLPLYWAAGLGFLILCFLEGLCIIGIANSSEVGVFFWCIFKLGEACLLVFLVLSLRQLQEGGRQLAAGNLDYKVPLDKLKGAFREHGENLNNIRQGIQHAVEEQMKSERMKTELITNVSHDIKTPLTSIVNYVDLLKKEEMPNEKAREYLEVLDRQSARLKKLTEDLVEASKASTGNLTVNFQRTDVNVLLTQSAGEYQERLAARDMTLVLTPAEEAPAISADGRLLWRIFENLFSNICKYAMPGTRVYLTSQATESQVTITFRNISADPLNISSDELMERFVRGDASRNTEGSGLGLSIARSLTQLQHGQFELTIDGDLFKAMLTFPRIP